MSAKRIDTAITRILAAFERIEVARQGMEDGPAQTAETPGSARVLALINAHERLREEVADTIGELDALIEELEE